ncbi:hypothetical protein AB7714_13945 [Tardiphaga sp. 1201_B9_N1_1]|uniref:hypothetical protein n=1 Tax=unclassified Tardiphaga TaxID=2631404 RepID=UPI003F267E64
MSHEDVRLFRAKGLHETIVPADETVLSSDATGMKHDRTNTQGDNAAANAAPYRITRAKIAQRIFGEGC